MDKKVYTIESDPDGIFWRPRANGLTPIPYCRIHGVPLNVGHPLSTELTCPIGDEEYDLKFDYQSYSGLVKEIVNNPDIKNHKLIRIDNSGTRVIAKERIDTNPEYFIESKLSDTQKGLELMIQVGKTDKSGKKVQLFVDLPAERLGFDKSDKDKHPAGMFSEITATFKNSSTKITDK
jgi:hypothetical protein